jgi:hypothetical protein
LGSFCQNLGSFGEFLGSFANYGFSSRRYQRIRDLVVEDTSAWKNQNTFCFFSRLIVSVTWWSKILPLGKIKILFAFSLA